MKILVIQKKMMGDILMSSVLFKQLRRKFPEAELHYLIGRMGYDVVRQNPDIKEYVFFDDYSFTGLVKKLKGEKYNYIIDAYAKTATAALCFLSGAKSISFRKGYTRWFYNYTAKRASENKSHVTTKAIEHRLQLLEPLGISFEQVTPDIFVTEDEKESAIKNLNDAGVGVDDKLVMISTLGSNECKTYPTQYMANIIEQVAEYPVKIILNHRAGEEYKIERLLKSLTPETKQKIVNEIDLNTLRSFIGICSQCKMLVGNEGGSTNVSKALRVPTFSIYAPFIDKAGWSWGENGTTNVSVHVNDFIKDTRMRNYANFKPELFNELLQKFLTDNIQNG